MKIILPFLLTLFVLTGCTTTKYSIQKYDPIKNDSQKSIVKEKKKILTASEELENKVEIENHTLAIVFPSYTIGKYALEATNSISTYLIHKNKKFKLNVYDIVTQNKENILKAIEQIQEDKVTKVIAMITKEDLIH